MKLTGSYKLNVNKETVWKALNDPNILKNAFLDVNLLKKRAVQYLMFRQQIKLDL